MNGEVVYVVGAPPTTMVKIGRSVNVSERLRTLQAASPLELRLIDHFPGDAALERSLHKQFTDLRRHGEWFDFAGRDIQASIAVAVARAGDGEPSRRRKYGEGSIYQRKDGYWVASISIGRCKGDHLKRDGKRCRGGERRSARVVRRTELELLVAFHELRRSLRDA